MIKTEIWIIYINYVYEYIYFVCLVYGANVLKMTSAEATRAVNEANALARRILKSLENQQPVMQ